MTLSSCLLVGATTTMVALPRNRRAIQNRVAPLRVGDLEVDALRKRIRLGTREVVLSPDEHILLYMLVARAGDVLTYRELATALGQTRSVIRNNTIARHVSHLRRKLGDDAGHPHYIHTVVGVGYGVGVQPHAGPLVANAPRKASRIPAVEAPALIVSDLDLPGIDGAEFLLGTARRLLPRRPAVDAA